MLYNVRLALLVVGDTGSCYVERDLQLPFAPFPRLQLALGPEGLVEDAAEEVVNVYWEEKNQYFLAACKPWEDRRTSFEDQLATLRARGWQVQESTLRRTARTQ
jgi:hypothetical protein